MKGTIFLIFIFAFTVTGLGQNVSISGTVEGAQGQSVRLIAYEDFISKKIITLDTEPIEDDGSFTLEFYVHETFMAFLDINYQRAEIFLEPDTSYSIHINYSKENQTASYYDREGLAWNFTEQDTTELNHVIWRFNALYNDFIMRDFSRIYKLHDKSAVLDFKEDLEKYIEVPDSGYFTDYVTYKLAGIEQFARLKSKRSLAQDYFIGKPVLEDNVEYTYFFEQFFEKFLITNPEVITVSDLIIAVNDSIDKELIMAAMKKAPYLQDKNFRELILLHGLKALYYDATYEKAKVLVLIKEIKATSHNPIHKKIAANLLDTLTALAKGSPAPDIELTGIAGQKFNLKNIKGKPIYLTFFRSSQKGTANAFTKLSEIFNVYSSGLEVISVSMDHDPSEYHKLANSGSYYWTFAHYGNDPLVYDLYNIRDLPLYVLIDVEGNIALFPAPEPGEELERAIMKVIH